MDDIRFACMKNDVATIQKLCRSCDAQSALNLCESRDLGGTTPLILASYHGNYEVVCELSINQNVNLDHTDKNQMSALHHACENSHTTIARFLILNGADVTCESAKGWTALHYAAESLNFDLCELLLQKSCSPFSFDVYGKSPVNIVHSKQKKLNLLRTTTSSKGSLGRSTEPQSILAANHSSHSYNGNNDSDLIRGILDLFEAYSNQIELTARTPELTAISMKNKPKRKRIRRASQTAAASHGYPNRSNRSSVSKTKSRKRNSFVYEPLANSNSEYSNQIQMHEMQIELQDQIQALRARQSREKNVAIEKDRHTRAELSKLRDKLDEIVHSHETEVSDLNGRVAYLEHESTVLKTILAQLIGNVSSTVTPTPNINRMRLSQTQPPSIATIMSNHSINLVQEQQTPQSKFSVAQPPSLLYSEDPSQSLPIITPKGVVGINQVFVVPKHGRQMSVQSAATVTSYHHDDEKLDRPQTRRKSPQPTPTRNSDQAESVFNEICSLDIDDADELIPVISSSQNNQTVLEVLEENENASADWNAVKLNLRSRGGRKGYSSSSRNRLSQEGSQSQEGQSQRSQSRFESTEYDCKNNESDAASPGAKLDEPEGDTPLPMEHATFDQMYNIDQPFYPSDTSAKSTPMPRPPGRKYNQKPHAVQPQSCMQIEIPEQEAELPRNIGLMPSPLYLDANNDSIYVNVGDQIDTMRENAKRVDEYARDVAIGNFLLQKSTLFKNSPSSSGSGSKIRFATRNKNGHKLNDIPPATGLERRTKSHTAIADYMDYKYKGRPALYTSSILASRRNFYQNQNGAKSERVYSTTVDARRRRARTDMQNAPNIRQLHIASGPGPGFNSLTMQNTQMNANLTVNVNVDMNNSNYNGMGNNNSNSNSNNININSLGTSRSSPRDGSDGSGSQSSEKKRLRRRLRRNRKMGIFSQTPDVSSRMYGDMPKFNYNQMRTGNTTPLI